MNTIDGREPVVVDNPTVYPANKFCQGGKRKRSQALKKPDSPKSKTVIPYRQATKSPYSITATTYPTTLRKKVLDILSSFRYNPP